jgi:hypothetical protein
MHKADPTIQSFAGFLQIEEKTVFRMAQGGELPGLKVRRQWRFEQARAVPAAQGTPRPSCGARAPSRVTHADAGHWTHPDEGKKV